jgi:anionic cell wall polymer biosynthesis LytR-Cps2A-Psr (LCP) family protein
MYHDTGEGVINLHPGVQRLNGNQAIQLVRFRGYGSGQYRDDFGRMKMQQEFLTALAKEVFTLGSLFKIGEFVNIAKENLFTDLDVTDLLWFAQEMISYNIENIHFHTLPSSAGYHNRLAYVFVHEDEALELINRTINPFTRDITHDDVDILVMR